MPLAVPFEHGFVVPGLGMPGIGEDRAGGGNQGDAITLLVERATAAG